MLFVMQAKDRRASCRIPKGFGAAWRKAVRSKRNCFIGKQYHPEEALKTAHAVGGFP